MIIKDETRTVNFAGYECSVAISHYDDEFKRPHLQLYDVDDYAPVATATSNFPYFWEHPNLGSAILSDMEDLDLHEYMNPWTLIKDYSENSGVLDALVQANIVKPWAEFLADPESDDLLGNINGIIAGNGTVRCGNVCLHLVTVTDPILCRDYARQMGRVVITDIDESLQPIELGGAK